MSDPLVSFIVLSYNYESYIGIALRSILDQSVQDFEIVVVDDASSDRSCEVVRAFGDPRIRLHVNEANMGGAWSYNRAVALARGAFLVNLDADDWIDPRKTAAQLEAMAREPSVDILGTHVVFVGADGSEHPRARELEAYTNQPHDFNLVDTWVVQNALCRSSTMIRRAAHERIGLDEPSMVRAPDYELWTRALRLGCRFGLLSERLTYLRVHSRGVTYGDPRGGFLETCHLLLKNVVPTIEERATYGSFGRMLQWITEHEQFALLRPRERYRLVGMFLASPSLADYAGFRGALSAGESATELVTAGRRFLALLSAGPGQDMIEKLEADIEKLEADIEPYFAARDHHRQQADNWQREAASQRQQAANWQREAENRQRELVRLKRLVDPLGIARLALRVKRLLVPDRPQPRD